MTSFFSAQENISLTDSSVLSLNNTKEITINSKENSKPRYCYDALKALEKSKEASETEGCVIIYLQGLTITAMQEINEHAQRIEVASLSIADMILAVDSKQNKLDVSVYIRDLQFDNQMFEQGGFDFPVVLISQKPQVKKEKPFYLSSCLKSNITQITENSLIGINFNFDVDGSKKGKAKLLKLIRKLCLK